METLDLTGIETPKVVLPGGKEIELAMARPAAEEEELMQHLQDMGNPEKRYSATDSAFDYITQEDPTVWPFGVKSAVVMHYVKCFRASMDPTRAISEEMSKADESD